MNNNSILPHVAVIIIITSAGLASLQLMPRFEIEQLSMTKPTSSQDNNIVSAKEYTFYDVLKEGEVVVTESNYTSTPKTSNLKHPTLLQIAATSSQDSALALTRRLKNAGLESVHVVERKSSKGLLYLVRTEPYNTYDTLKAGMALAEKLNFHPDKIAIK